LAAVGQNEPPRLGAVVAELTSIADADETWRRSTVRPRPARRRMFPRNRPPRLTGLAPAPGHEETRTLLATVSSQPVQSLLFDRRFTDGLANLRAQSMKSCAAGLMVRFFKVTMPLGADWIGIGATGVGGTAPVGAIITRINATPSEPLTLASALHQRLGLIAGRVAPRRTFVGVQPGRE